MDFKSGDKVRLDLNGRVRFLALAGHEKSCPQPKYDGHLCYYQYFWHIDGYHYVRRRGQWHLIHESQLRAVK
jgi:hypothetical protein